VEHLDGTGAAVLLLAALVDALRERVARGPGAPGAAVRPRVVTVLDAARGELSSARGARLGIASLGDAVLGEDLRPVGAAIPARRPHRRLAAFEAALEGRSGPLIAHVLRLAGLEAASADLSGEVRAALLAVGRVGMLAAAPAALKELARDLLASSRVAAILQAALEHFPCAMGAALRTRGRRAVLAALEAVLEMRGGALAARLRVVPLVDAVVEEALGSGLAAVLARGLGRLATVLAAAGEEVSRARRALLLGKLARFEAAGADRLGLGGAALLAGGRRGRQAIVEAAAEKLRLLGTALVFVSAVLDTALEGRLSRAPAALLAGRLRRWRVTAAQAGFRELGRARRADARIAAAGYALLVRPRSGGAAPVTAREGQHALAALEAVRQEALALLRAVGGILPGLEAPRDKLPGGKPAALLAGRRRGRGRIPAAVALATLEAAVEDVLGEDAAARLIAPVPQAVPERRFALGDAALPAVLRGRQAMLEARAEDPLEDRLALLLGAAAGAAVAAGDLRRAPAVVLARRRRLGRGGPEAALEELGPDGLAVSVETLCLAFLEHLLRERVTAIGGDRDVSLGAQGAWEQPSREHEERQ
jgi:hypothetical protein